MMIGKFSLARTSDDDDEVNVVRAYDACPETWRSLAYSSGVIVKRLK